MIGKVCRRGSDVRRLLFYLFREGRAGEQGLASDHTDAHLVAGWEDPTSLEPTRGPDGQPDLRRLAGLLTAPLAAVGLTAKDKPVYHLALSAAKDAATGALVDRLLTDTEWAEVAAEYLHHLGLAPRGDSSGVRWVAVRHASDHIHVVVTLARQDGRRVWPYRDYQRCRQASHAVEQRYGLTPTRPAGATGVPETTRGEHRRRTDSNTRRRQAGQSEQPVPDRDLLRRRVRAAAAASTDAETFLARLRAGGTLVRERHSTQEGGELTGYAVAAPAAPGSNAPVIWFGGGRLGADLTLPALQRRWQTGGIQPGKIDRAAGKTTAPAPAGQGKTADYRSWDRAAALSALAAKHLLQASHGRSTAREGDGLARAAADLLAVLAQTVVGHEHDGVGVAADVLTRAAPRQGTQRTGTPSALPLALRCAARELSRRPAARPTTDQVLQLVQRLAGLADALAELRTAQGRHDAARCATEARRQLMGYAARTAAPPSRSAPPRPLRPPPHVDHDVTSR